MSEFRTNKRSDGSSYHYPVGGGDSYIFRDLDTIKVENDIAKLDCVELSVRTSKMIKHMVDDSDNMDMDSYNESLSLLYGYLEELKSRCSQIYEDIKQESEQFGKLLTKFPTKYEEYFDIENEPNIEDFTNKDIISAIRNMRYDAEFAKEEIEKLKKKDKLTEEELRDLDDWEDTLEESIQEISTLTYNLRKNKMWEDRKEIQERKLFDKIKSNEDLVNKIKELKDDIEIYESELKIWNYDNKNCDKQREDIIKSAINDFEEMILEANTDLEFYVKEAKRRNMNIDKIDN